MRFFKRKKKPAGSALNHIQGTRYMKNGTPPETDFTVKLSGPLLERIFSFVCAHTQDETYENCEQSALDGDSCMLCDLRDLAHCAQVSRRWRILAPNVLYCSIRIDAVHYCEREGILAEKRKHRSKLNRNAEPEDVPKARLQLLGRTLREYQDSYALKVLFLKVPYMTRETCKPDLARVVNVCPNLRYLDLPEGIFQDDPSCNTLRQEMMGRCRDLRKMSYMSGAERELEQLASGRLWPNLEVLELARLNMDPTIIRQALGSLQYLHALKISDMPLFDDQLLQHHDRLPPFPAVKELIFINTPNVTAEGLEAYLFRSDTQDSLTTLSLTATGVSPATLQQILAVAPKLTNLSIIETVTMSIPASNNIQPLSSTSLKILHYEITSGSSPHSYTNPAASFYSLLSLSLISNGLPMLRELYVRDPDFPESLIDLAPPAPAFASDPDNFSGPRSPTLSPESMHNTNNRFSSNNPFAPKLPPSPELGGLKQELVVYSKGLDEMEWNFSRVQPASEKGRRGSVSAARPISSYGLGDNLASPWGSNKGARQSVIVGNGFGGFLAIPAEDGRPSSSAGERGKKRGSEYDMWR